MQLAAQVQIKPGRLPQPSLGRIQGPQPAAPKGVGLIGIGVPAPETEGKVPFIRVFGVGPAYVTEAVLQGIHLFFRPAGKT
jgi:hypothetical protein